MAMTIDDLIVLGRAGPESIQDGRHTVCLGGYSPTHGFVRLYPTRMDMNELRRWNIVEVDVVDTDGDDIRDESYKLEGSKENWNSLNDCVKKVGRLSKKEQIELVDGLPKTCRNVLNENRDSLGVVAPDFIREAELEPVDPEPKQQDLEGENKLSKSAYPNKLYLDYTCADCKAKTGHRQHCIEWGMYRYWDTNPDKDPETVIDALGVTNPDYYSYLFIGNLRYQLTSYIVISVLRFKRSELRAAGVRPADQTGLTTFENEQSEKAKSGGRRQ